MSEQMLFNIVVGVAAFFGGWTLKSISRSLERLDKDVRDMPHIYVSKADYKDDINHIKVTLDRIFDHIGQLNSTKADK